MRMRRLGNGFRSAAAGLALALVAAKGAFGHFLWITLEPSESGPAGVVEVHAHLSETPTPEGAGFLRFVERVRLRSGGLEVPSRLGEETRVARWSGPAAAMYDAESDLGVRSREGSAHRLVYTARGQTRAVSTGTAETEGGLRARLAFEGSEGDGEGEEAGGRRTFLEALFDGRPLANARLRVYESDGSTREIATDSAGRAEIGGLATGETAVWVNWSDGTPGEWNGTAYEETRHYATLTIARPEARGAAETMGGSIPEPAVNSFGGAVLGDYLYVYGGHLGRTHRYSTETATGRFRRWNLAKGGDWEDLVSGPALQGVSLTADEATGRLYRVGGMAARNAPGTPPDLHSVADAAVYDPGTGVWRALPSMPEARSTHDAAIAGRTLYVAGGWNLTGKASESEFAEGMLALDLEDAGKGWRRIEQPFRRRALAMAEAGGRLFVVGGLDEEGGTSRRLEIYDPSSGEWTRGPDLPGRARNEGFGPSAFGIEGRLYVSGASGSIARLNGGCDGWELVGALGRPRITHRLLPGPGRSMLMVAGTSGGRSLSDIERHWLPEEGDVDRGAGGAGAAGELEENGSSD